MPRRVAFQCLTLDHQAADVATRGQLACTPDEAHLLLTDPLRPSGPAFILSTCNRIELYWIGTVATGDWWRARALALGAQAAFAHRSGKQAARHLLRVASGLESRMLGEREILGQVRNAVQRSRSAGTLGRRLGHIADGAIAGARRVRRASLLDRHARAASAAMVDWVEAQLTEGLRGRTVLVLGAGQAAEGAVRALVEHGAGRIILANRNQARAAALAADCGTSVTVVGWEHFGELAAMSDVIITATAAMSPVLEAEHLTGAARARRADDPLHVLDLGVPANVAPAVRELRGVRLTDLDGLRTATCPEGPQSDLMMADVDRLVEHELRVLTRDVRARRLARTLAQLHALGAVVAEEEAGVALDALGPLSEAERRICEQLAARVARRILYRVSKVLREEAAMPRRRKAGAA
jgi:glutamyl-tRNA reductase